MRYASAKSREMMTPIKINLPMPSNDVIVNPVNPDSKSVAAARVISTDDWVFIRKWIISYKLTRGIAPSSSLIKIHYFQSLPCTTSRFFSRFFPLKWDPQKLIRIFWNKHVAIHNYRSGSRPYIPSQALLPT
jgi:hypothetical protein